jgi:type III secretory pathway component EscU
MLCSARVVKPLEQVPLDHSVKALIKKVFESLLKCIMFCYKVILAVICSFDDQVHDVGVVLSQIRMLFEEPGGDGFVGFCL